MSGDIGTSDISFSNIVTAYNNVYTPPLPTTNISSSIFRGKTFSDDSSVPSTGAISIGVNFKGKTWGGSSTISSWTLKNTLSDPSGLDAGFAHYTASISGDGAWISIGSEDKYPNDAYSVGFGNVFMYTKSTDITWSETQTISNPTPDEYFFGKRTKLSRDGNYLYVCSSDSKTYLFKRTNNTWNSTTAIIDHGQPDDISAQLSEDGTYVAHALFIGGQVSYSEVLLYKKSADDTSMEYLETITAPPNNAWESINISMSDAGDILCVGAPYENSSTGNVYVYTRDVNDNWSTSPDTTFQPPELGGYFGFDVSISGDGNYIATSALLYDEVYIYKRSGSSWSLSSTINGPSGYAFGVSVALSQYADYLVVGSYYEPDFFTGDHAYVYYKDGNDAWTLKQTLTEGSVGSGFGRDVHISSTGNYLLITANATTANAYVYYGT